MQRLSRISNPVVVTAIVSAGLFLHNKFGARLLSVITSKGKFNVKVDGEDVSNLDIVPAMGGFPAYLDVTGK